MLYLKHDFAERNPNTVQALVNAFYGTLKWMEKASPEEVAATVPQEYYLGDKALYVAAVKANKEAYSVTGMIPEGGMKSAADMLLAFDDELKGSKIDLAQDFRRSLRPQGRRPVDVSASRLRRVAVVAGFKSTLHHRIELFH